jgi:hypothetical protein
MKKIGIAFIALVAILVLPGAAKADSFTGASGGTTDFFGTILNGAGSFAGGESFSFSDSLFGGGNFIKIGSFTGAFTGGGFAATGVGCGFFCVQYAASFVGTGASAGETGTITLDVNPFTGQIENGSADPNAVAGVPEPGTLGMFAAGLLGVGLMLSRRSKSVQVTA